MSVPPVPTNGLPEPSRAAPIASIASRSSAIASEVSPRHRLVLEGQVDDAVGLGGRLVQAVEVVEVAAADLGAGGLERGGRAVGAGQADDLVAGPSSSGTTAEPMCPDAPVTNTRMVNLRVDALGAACARRRMMSLADIKLADTAPSVIGYTRRMTRWEPDASGRLRQAALELYGERGYDRPRSREIAERAGLTKRTFFRYFADKREVLFGGSDVLQELFVTEVGAAPEPATPLDAVAAALEAVAASFEEPREPRAAPPADRRRPTRSCRSAS